MSDVPMPSPVNYGSALAKAHDAKVTLLNQATGIPHGFPEVTLVHSTRGYECAGSMMRWTDAYWAVCWTARDGAGLGQRFREDDEASARAYFAKMTDPQEVSRRRQEEAMLEETVYAPYRAKVAAENAARAQAERDRKSALARFRRQQRAAGARSAARA